MQLSKVTRRVLMSHGKVEAIRVGTFCTLTTSDFAEKYGVKKGDVLYVAGDAITSVDEDDPYKLRRILLCALLDVDGNVLEGKGAITIDGLKLKPVSETKQNKLSDIFTNTFGGDDEGIN